MTLTEMAAYEDSVYELEGVRCVLRVRSLQGRVFYTNRYSRALPDDQPLQALAMRIRTHLGVHAEFFNAAGEPIRDLSTPLAEVRRVPEVAQVVQNVFFTVDVTEAAAHRVFRGKHEPPIMVYTDYEQWLQKANHGDYCAHVPVDRLEWRTDIAGRVTPVTPVHVDLTGLKISRRI